jgi:hypothetical protein
MKAETTPTVLDEFSPLLTIPSPGRAPQPIMAIQSTLTNLRTKPDIELINRDPNAWSNGKKIPQITLAVTDSDAPSRDNPEWREICQWIVTDVGFTQPDDEGSDDDDIETESVLKKRMLDVMPYKRPGPFPNTGKHRFRGIGAEERHD